MTGVWWAVVAGVGFGVFQIVNRRAGRYLEVLPATFILLVISSAILLAVSLLFEDLAMLWQAGLAAFIYFGLAGFIHFFLGWTWLSVSQKRVGAARTGALLGATPFFGTLIGALFFGEFLDVATLAGIILVVAGVYLVSSG